MDQRKRWRFEANNPQASKEWKPLFEVSEEELPASVQLRDELNKVNSPLCFGLSIRNRGKSLTKYQPFFVSRSNTNAE